MNAAKIPNRSFVYKMASRPSKPRVKCPHGASLPCSQCAGYPAVRIEARPVAEFDGRPLGHDSIMSEPIADVIELHPAEKPASERPRKTSAERSEAMRRNAQLRWERVRGASLVKPDEGSP